MFDKMTIALEKSSLIAILGLMIAACALILIKRGLITLTLQEAPLTPKHIWARGAILCFMGAINLLLGIIIILNSERVFILLVRKMDFFTQLFDCF
jgi:hypothetical protein